MTTLRKNEFMDMLEMNNILFEDKDKFIHCDIPTLGKVTYYPKSDKLQICRKNKWEEGGFEYVKTILKSTTKTHANNSSKSIPVVFWANFKGKNTECDRFQRWVDGKEPTTIIEWIFEKRIELELKYSATFCVTNCGVVR